jgi:hypothetical protein
MKEWRTKTRVMTEPRAATSDHGPLVQSFNIAEPFVESAKELAPEFIQDIPNVRIVEVFCVAIQVTALSRLRFCEMGDNGG